MMYSCCRSSFPQKVIHTSILSLVVHIVFCVCELEERPSIKKYAINTINKGYFIVEEILPLR